jgi:putative ATP-dependent endonuclease of the OLD family
MILKKTRVQNYRSIKDSNDIPLSRIFAFIGENNAGKSNLIRAIESFISAGAGGIAKPDFNDPDLPIILKGEFVSLTPSEKRRWRSYLVGESLTLEKHLQLEVDDRSGKEKVSAEFHGYKAEPKEWFLSIVKIEERAASKVDWKKIVDDNKLPQYFIEAGKSTKAIFQKALFRFLEENEVEYDAPDISATQALGLQSNVVATLPSIYFLRAITDYNDEIDKRSTSTTFRRLMGELSERILKKDPKYREVQAALDIINSLLNRSTTDEPEKRLVSLAKVEARFTELLKKLMPSVERVTMAIVLDEIKDIFSSGVTLSVDDGVDTSVLAKGHGLQRCLVFTLLQTLIMNERNQLIPENGVVPADETHHIILAIEEPELYIHPQLGKLFYDVMQEFSKTDQVIYSTHSPVFIDAFEYDKLGIVKKANVLVGTTVQVCNPEIFDGLEERKIFQGLTRLNPVVSEMFFARRILLVEGPEDQVAITSVLQDEKKIINRVEELGWSILVAWGKPSIPFFQRILNGFNIPYAVLHDHDITGEMDANDKDTNEKQNNTISSLANGNMIYEYPVRLEESLGLDHHFKGQYEAYKFFEDRQRITPELRKIVTDIFS